MTEYVKLDKATDDIWDEAACDHFETQYDCARVEFEEGSWKVKKDLSPDADGTRSLGTAAARYKDVRALNLLESGPHLHDDFIGAVLDTNLWHAAGDGGAGLAPDTDGGAMVVQSGSAIMDEESVDQGGYRCFRYGKKVKLSMRLKISEHLQQMMLDLGLWKDSTHYLLFTLTNVASATDWYAETCNGSTPDSTDTLVLSDLDWHVFEIRCESGHVYFDIDGTNVADVAADIPTDNMEPYIHMRTTEGEVKTILVDYIDAYQER
jgi:hypothetical protein